MLWSSNLEHSAKRRFSFLSTQTRWGSDSLGTSVHASCCKHTPYDVRDWRTHFYHQRKWFFGINIILGVLTTMMISGILPGVPVNIVPTVGYSLITALSIVGFISDNPKIHAYVVLIVASFTLLYFGVATFRPVSY